MREHATNPELAEQAVPWSHASGGGEFRFQLKGGVGAAYQIQSSADLATWTAVAEVTCTSTPSDCSVAVPAGGGRFYRAGRR